MEIRQSNYRGTVIAIMSPLHSGTQARNDVSGPRECFSAIADTGDVRKALKLEYTIEDISIESTDEIDAHNHERRIVCVEIAK